MSDAREVIARAVQDHAYPEGLPEIEKELWGDYHKTTNLGFADSVLSALKDAGLVVVDTKPALEAVWVQNLCGFIDGKFVQVDDKWRDIWKTRVRALVEITRGAE